MRQEWKQKPSYKYEKFSLEHWEMETRKSESPYEMFKEIIILHGISAYLNKHTNSDEAFIEND